MPTQLAEEIARRSKRARWLNWIDLILNQQEFQPENAERLAHARAQQLCRARADACPVARLREHAPGIKLRMTPFGNDLAETGVISGTTAMVLGRIVDPPDNLVVQHLMDDGLACVVRVDHPDVRDRISREQYEGLKHVNVLPPGRLRAGLFQVLGQQNLKREVAVSVTHFLAVPEMLAVTDYCATLPRLICRSMSGIRA